MAAGEDVVVVGFPGREMQNQKGDFGQETENIGNLDFFGRFQKVKYWAGAWFAWGRRVGLHGLPRDKRV
jgi:hypothetical protein